MESSFVPLACHSTYSLLWGTASPEALCRRARQAGVTTLALTDRNGLYGILPFWEAARETGLRPLIGAHLAGPPCPALLLAAEPCGYRRLARILTLFHQEKSKGQEQGFCLLEALQEDRRGLVVLSPSVPFLEGLARASGTARDLYIALYPHGPQRARIHGARKTGIPLAAVAPVFFLDRSDYPLHRLLRAIGLRTKLDRVPARESAPSWAFFQGPGRWVQRYLHCPEALQGMRAIAERCHMEEPPWGPWAFPTFEGLTEEGAFVLLEKKSHVGALRRYGTLSPPVGERLAYELGIIRAKGLASYFLVVEDIVSRFPITCGRGSAAASLVSFCLGITHVDPLAHNLFFERFLNPGRNEPPDIDVDFPWDERDAVLSYVLDKYGPERCAMVANHVSFGMGAALRETAKVYGIPEQEIRRVCDSLDPARGPFRSPDHGEEASGQGAGSRGDHLPEPWPAVLRWACRLAGIPRHLSVHCGGVVITPDPLPERVPVERAAKGVPVIQWEKDGAEAAGLVKIDLLGNRSLAVIRDALASIEANHGLRLSYSQIMPLEDPKTRQMLARGDTVGVFYVESPAMRQLLKKTGKGDFEHLVVQSSIIRPAANEFIREYVRRLRGGTYRPLHPLLADLLKETHGILCYQEDVSRVAMALAGFDAVQADQLRKVLSKKHKRARLPDYRDRFFRGALGRGIPREVIEEVWRMILSFQGYSFCKPHSASYALVSFKACWLKAHFPAEFMAAVLSNQGGYYTTMAYLSEARRMGLAILPPDINASAYPYTGTGRTIRVGLMQLKGIRQASLEALLGDRARRGPFISMGELLRRVDIDPADLRVLIKAGCLDSISQGRPRPALLWELLAWEAGRRGRTQAGKARREQAGGGGSPDIPILRKTSRGEESPGSACTWKGEGINTRPMPPLLSPGALSIPLPRPYRPDLRLRHELETLGLLVSLHPLEAYRAWLPRNGTVPASGLPEYVGRKVATVGWFVTGKTVLTRREEPMEFVSFEDTTALYETTFFPRVYGRFRNLLSHHRPYLLQGRVEEDFGAISLNVEQIIPLGPAWPLSKGDAHPSGERGA